MDLKQEITIPFAEKGSRQVIPETALDGSVSMEFGYDTKYGLNPDTGGELISRQSLNQALYKVYAAVKELQTIAKEAGFPINLEQATGVLGLTNGGTGADTAEGARTQLELGQVALLNEIDLNSSIVKGPLGTGKGGMGNSDGYLFSNAMTPAELRNRFPALGSGAVTTQQFVDIITAGEKTAFRVNMVNATALISDCPLSNAILDVVRFTDNTVLLKAVDLFNFSECRYSKLPDGTITGWVIIEGSNIRSTDSGGTGLTFPGQRIFSKEWFASTYNVTFPTNMEAVKNAVLSKTSSYNSISIYGLTKTDVIDAPYSSTFIVDIDRCGSDRVYVTWRSILTPLVWIGLYANNTFLGWTQITGTTTMPISLPYTIHNTGVDLNTLTSSGLYKIDRDIVNGDGYHLSGTCFVVQTPLGVSQYFFSPDGWLFFRNKYANNEWKTWRNIHDGNGILNIAQ